MPLTFYAGGEEPWDAQENVLLPNCSHEDPHPQRQTCTIALLRQDFLLFMPQKTVLSLNLPQCAISTLFFSQITKFLCCHSMPEVSLSCWLTPRQWCSPPCSPFHASFALCSCHVLFISQLCSLLFPLLLYFLSHTVCSMWVSCMSERVAEGEGMAVTIPGRTLTPGRSAGAELGCSRVAACGFMAVLFSFCARTSSLGIC